MGGFKKLLKNNNIDFDAVPNATEYQFSSDTAANPHLEAELKDLKIDRAKLQKELKTVQ
jgi:hypothetical protein